MKLMVEVLLVLSAALLQDLGDAAETLDMAEKSVDNQYCGCSGDLENRVFQEYLEKERKRNTKFDKEWKEGKSKYGNKNHLTAVHVYTGTQVYGSFNKAVQKGKEDYRRNTFSWYSLHYFLTSAVKTLNGNNKCYNTYRGVNVTFKTEDMLNKEFRFGRFASSSLDRSEAAKFGTKTCFEIRTCRGADVSQYSQFSWQQEVLIPPYETFKVTRVQTRKDNKDLWCGTVFSVEHSGTRSDLNCAVISAATSHLSYVHVFALNCALIAILNVLIVS